MVVPYERKVEVFVYRGESSVVIQLLQRGLSSVFHAGLDPLI